MPTSPAPDVRPPEVRLRLPTGWLTVPEGRHEIGRNPSCDILLEGDRVSRLHARILVDADGAAIEDLASSNGVYVNDERIVGGARRLLEGDCVRLGEIEILVSYEAAPIGDASGPILVRTTPRPAPPLPHAAPTSPGIPVSLDLLGSVAERIIAAGEPRRAEGMLQANLERMLESARAGRGIDPSAHDRAIHLALTLAKTLPSPAWVDWTFDLLAALGLLPSEMQLAEIERAAAAVDGVDPGRLGRYSDVIRALPTSIEKLRVLQRVERLTSELRTASSRR